MKNHRIALLFVFIFLAASAFFSQNKFEGYNLFLDVPDNQKVATCALRYVSPETTLTITDLDARTPMKVSSCGGGEAAGSSIVQNGNTATLRASATNYKWCFSGEDKSYRISFRGDQSAGQVTYNWVAASATNGVYNIKDFGAVGDGTTDDTIAFKSAMAFIASRNGGTLQIPEGDFVVTSTVALPPGIIIQVSAASRRSRRPTTSSNRIRAASNCAAQTALCSASANVRKTSPSKIWSFSPKAVRELTASKPSARFCRRRIFILSRWFFKALIAAFTRTVCRLRIWSGNSITLNSTTAVSSIIRTREFTRTSEIPIGKFREAFL